MTTLPVTAKSDLTSLTHVQSDNPIVWQELNYQIRTRPNWLRILSRFGPLSLAALILMLTFSLTDTGYPTRQLALYIVWLVHAITITRCIIAATNAISREHIGQTWDALVLTGIGARRILMGKWRAVLRRMSGWMFAYGLIQLSLVPIIAVGFMNINQFNRFNGFNTNRLNMPPPTLNWLTWTTVLALAVIIMLTILEVVTSTALGIAASAITRHGIPAAILAFTVRFLPVAIFGVYTQLEVGARFSRGGNAALLLRGTRFTTFALADGANSLLYTLAAPSFGRGGFGFDQTGTIMVGVLLATFLLLIFLGFALVTAWMAIRATGALPDIKEPKQSEGFHLATED